MFINGNSYTRFRNISLTDGIVRFGSVLSAALSASSDMAIYVRGTTLYFWNGASETAITTGTGAGATSWDDLYDADQTLAIDGTSTLTFDVQADIDGLTVSKSGAGTGSPIVIANSGTDYDIAGPAWSIISTGSVGILELASGGTINATDGALTIGKSDTITDIAGKFRIAGTAAAASFTLTAGDAVMSDSSLAITDADNATTFTVTNDTATTATGVVKISADGVTSGIVIDVNADALENGTILHLDSTVAAMTTGLFIDCFDGAASAFSVGIYGTTTIAGAEANNVFVITAGDAVISLGSLTMTDNDNASALSVTADSVTTDTSGAIFLSADGLTAGYGLYLAHTTSVITTGSVLKVVSTGVDTGTGQGTLADFVSSGTAAATVVKVTTAALTTGKAMQISAGATLTEGSLLYVQDTGANCALTSGTVATFNETATKIEADVNRTGSTVSVSSSRTLNNAAKTVADDFDTLYVYRSATNTAGTMSSAGSVLYVQNDCTGTITDSVNGIEIVMDSGGTGNAISVTHAATAGRALVIASSGTTAAGIISVTANALTSGLGMYVTSSATAITGNGRLFYSYHSGATGSTATLNEFKSAANDETIILQVTASDVLAAGVAFEVSCAAMTTGSAIYVPDMAALTDGQGLYIVSSSTTISNTGHLLYVNHSGNAGVSAVLNEFKSAAADETVILKVNASAALAAGVAVQVTASSMTTGTAIQASTLNALTSGQGLHLASSSTAITTGHLLFVNHTGNATAGNPSSLVEMDSAAAEDTIILRLTASAALAGGKVFSIVADSCTTGIGIDMTMDALTSGVMVNLHSDVADATARSLVHIHNDNTGATGTSPLEVVQDSSGACIKTTSAATSTHFYKVLTSNDVTLWMSDGTTANGALAATTGDICFNGGSNKPEYCTNGAGSVWATIV